MANPAVEKFTFNDDFVLERRGTPNRRMQDRAALDEAEARGYATGFLAGQAAQQAQDETRLALAFETLAMQMSRIEKEMMTFLEGCEGEAVRLALSLVDLYGLRIKAVDPHAGFAAAIHDVIAQFPSANRLVARVPAPITEAVSARMARLAEETRFSGQLIVEPLPAGADESDFVLEWPDGALKHDRRALQQRLEKEFAHFGFALGDMNHE